MGAEKLPLWLNRTHRILRLSGITGQGVSPFFEARRERLTAFQVLACKIMPERRLRFATISSASLVIRFH
jgi:hypothetical protein